MPAKVADLVKIHFFLLALLAFPTLILSQTPKGFGSTADESVATGKTRALVIGISKYEYIDTLQYADRDARIFADYLVQNNFWGISREDITLLVNDKAKYGNLTIELQRIALQCRPGDRLLFYFSGHGDVETNTMFNRGYLLAYDTYSSNYMANGLRVDDLKDVMVTLLNNQVKVILITDACRSGNLAGGIKGAEFTAAAISKMWNSEIKILSSQAGQLSQESEKWGKGQGVFSYYLVKGLNGEADADKDSVITLSELETFVGTNVARETNYKQQPIFEGPNKYSTVLVKLKSLANQPGPAKTGNSVQRFNAVRLPEDSCAYYFREMNAAIEQDRFDSRSQRSASFYYQRLKQCTKDSNLILQANSTLLSSLVNKVQEIVNNSFIGKNLVPEEKFDLGISLIDQALQNNDLKLPYRQHWTNLKRYLFVQGKATWHEETANKVSTDKLSLVIDSAIKDEPDAAYLLTAKAMVEMRKENWNKAIQLLNEALVKSPQWLIPKYQLGICYSKTKSFAKALDYYDEILRKDTTYKTFECTKCILGNMAAWAWEMKKYKKGIGYYLLSIDHFPDYWPPYEALYDYAVEKKDTATALQLISRFKKYDDTTSMRLMRIRFEYDFFNTPLSLSLPAVQAILKDNIDSSDYYYSLAIMYREEMSEQDSAVACYQKAIELDPTDLSYVLELSDYLVEIDDREAAAQLLLGKMDAYEGEEKWQLKFVLANLYIETGKLQEAFEILKDMKEAGLYTCADLRSMKKAFSDLAAYKEYIKTCRDK